MQNAFPARSIRSCFLILGISAAAALSGCAWLAAHQSIIQADAQALAVAIQQAEPLVKNQTASDILYGVQAVAQAYGKTPVPANVAQATAILPQIATAIVPLITGSQNNPRTQAVIGLAAQLLANSTPSPTPASSNPNQQ
jgi:hypothetical protein